MVENGAAVRGLHPLSPQTRVQLSLGQWFVLLGLLAGLMAQWLDLGYQLRMLRSELQHTTTQLQDHEKRIRTVERVIPGRLEEAP